MRLIKGLMGRLYGSSRGIIVAEDSCKRYQKAGSDSKRIDPVALCNYAMRPGETNKKFFWSIALLTGIVAACFSYNLYTSFFPVSLDIIGDDAEYLHVAYLLGQNQKPFVDFMEHHPMLFSQYLWWLHEIAGVTSIATWDIYL